MKSKICFLLIIWLLTVCLFSGQAVFSQEKVSSSDFIFEICGNLEVFYWNTNQVNYPAMLNIALQSARETLRNENVSFSYWPIIDTASPLEAKKRFTDEFDKIDRLLVEKNIKQEVIIFPAASAILRSFKDSHTGFISPESYKITKETANAKSFGGLGMEISSLDQNFYYIARVLKNTPAAAAGLKKFDVIMAVDGQRKFTDINNLCDRLRGPADSKVNITIQRKTYRGVIEEVNFQITRKNIKPDFYEKRMMTNKRNGHTFFYLNLRTFHINGAYNLIDAFSVLGADGIIIDLRNNSGGYLSICNGLMNQFIAANITLYYTKNTNSTERCVTSVCPKINLPVVVLINKNSASASEIFSGIMQEQGRATIVGKRSDGSVSIGTIRELSYGAAMMVTIQQFFTAKGKMLEKIGVKPDIEIDLTKENIINGVDTQLDKALEVLENQLKH